MEQRLRESDNFVKELSKIPDNIIARYTSEAADEIMNVDVDIPAGPSSAAAGSETSIRLFLDDADMDIEDRESSVDPQYVSFPLTGL